MPEYLSPGVYVEEQDWGPKPIQAVGTAMPAFVGFTQKAEQVREIDGEVVAEPLLNRPSLVTNWSQFLDRFGDFVEGAYLPHAVYGFFNNGGSRCYVVSVKTIDRAQADLLGSDNKPYLKARAKHAGYLGQDIRVKIEAAATPSSASSSSSSSSKSGSKAKGDDAKDDKGSSSSASSSAASSSSDDQSFTIIVEQRDRSRAWRERETATGVRLVEAETEAGAKEVMLADKNDRLPKFKLIDLLLPEATTTLAKMSPKSGVYELNLSQKELAPASSGEFRGNVKQRSGLEGLEALEDVTMLVVPDLMSTPPGEKLDLDMVKGVQTAMISHCEKMGDRVAILDSPPDMMPDEILEWRMETAGFDSSYATLYYPWVVINDPVLGQNIKVPPSGHMAGIWAGTDNSRGVHKAPANEVVQGAVGLEYNTTKGEQDMLNPRGINCIRAFPGRGIRVWGARTLSSDPSWIYINVRRLFNMVEKSIQNSTQWVVFEPNDHKLWARVRRDINAFLRTVWQDGALFGLSPDQAYFVKCDEELNPPESRDLGRLIVEIGMAPVKPAEFVIFRIGQWAGPNAE